MPEPEAIEIAQAQARWAQLIEALESGREREFVLLRHGKPAARLIAAHAGHAPKIARDERSRAKGFNRKRADSI
jgi:antitoxin (DNA-binding transcriptional repressor) of toxin-antitoxin stability system